MTEQKRKSEKLAHVKGMNDVLPQNVWLWEFFESTVKLIFRSYGYQNIRTPIVEHLQLFTRSIGEVTDIVEKEMYSFIDMLNGENLALRPENTAAVVRAAIEHNLLYDGPKRLWYIGPMFRHERPQRGRYRQFHQVGAESLGFAGPDVDAESILMCQRLWNDLGLTTGIRLEINSLGFADERAAHRVELMAYLTKYKEEFDDDMQRRLYTNPLRMLDSKNLVLQEIAQNAPKLIDFLGKESRAHFEELLRILKANNIPFEINPHLVRGLDYYNLTVFEWITDKLGAQGTVAAGGRYDSLIEHLGGQPTRACGWAMGIERILGLLKEQQFMPETEDLDVYIVHQGEAASQQAFIIAEHLRDTGINVILHCNASNQATSFRFQLKHAVASGAAFAVILGEDEIASSAASVKPLRVCNVQIAGGEQQKVPMEDLTEFLINAMCTVIENSSD